MSKKEAPTVEPEEQAATAPEKEQAKPSADLSAIVKSLAITVKEQAKTLALLEKELEATKDALRAEINGLDTDVISFENLAKVQESQGNRIATVESQLNKVGPAIAGIKKRIEQADDLNPKTRGYLMAHSKSNPSTVVPVEFDCTYGEARERAANDEDGNNYFFWAFVPTE